MKKMTFQFAATLAAIFAVIAIAIGTTRSTGFDPNAACVGNARMIGRAVYQYTQDYDENFPLMSSLSYFGQEMTPYLGDGGQSHLLCPVTGARYLPNRKLEGLSLAGPNQAYDVEIVRDAVAHPDGGVTVSYLDGHVDHGGVVQGDADAICVHRASYLVEAVLDYSNWNGGYLPPMDSQKRFEDAVLPYAHNRELFVCPDTGKLYNPNPALSLKPVASIVDQADTVLFSDPEPHSDGQSTVAYLDRHVVHGGITLLETVCQARLRAIGEVTGEYAADHGGYLPPTDSLAHFKDSLAPYSIDPNDFTCPDSGEPYVINKSIGGKRLIDIGIQILASDRILNDNGSYTSVYADGGVDTADSNYAAGLTSDSRGGLAILWNQGFEAGGFSRSSEIWDLSTAGTPFRKIDLLGYPPLFRIGSEPALIATIRGDKRIIVTPQVEDVEDITSPVDVTITTSVGAPDTVADIGGFGGWTPVFLANGGQPQSRLLWRRSTDGELALWTLTAQGKYGGDVRIDPGADVTPLGMVEDSSGNSRLLLSEPDGTAQVWTIEPNGAVGSKFTFTPTSLGQAPLGIAIGVDGITRLLWNDGDGTGRAEIWTADSGGQVTNRATVTVGSIWTPKQLVVDQDGDNVVLWTKIGAYGRLTRVANDGTLLYQRDFSPHQ